MTILRKRNILYPGEYCHFVNKVQRKNQPGKSGLINYGSLSNVGVNISWKKNREKTRRVAELPSLRLGSTMKDPVSESREFSDSEANTLENFYLVVATFCKAVRIMAVESIQH